MNVFKITFQLIILIFFSSFVINKTNGQIGWEARYGNSILGDIPYQTLVTADGSVYSIGISSSSGETLLGKVSDEGEVLWFQYMPLLLNSFNPLRLDSLGNGNLLISGTSSNNLIKWVEVDPQGTIISENELALSDTLFIPNRLNFTSEEHLVAVGKQANDGNAIYFVRCDLNGNIIAENALDPLTSPSSELSFSSNFLDNQLLETPDGGFVFGAIEHFSAFTQFTVITKLNAQGNLDWINPLVYGHNSDNEELQLLPDSSIMLYLDNLFAVDSLNAPGSFNIDARLIKLETSSGQAEWNYDVAFRTQLPVIVDEQGTFRLYSVTFPNGFVDINREIVSSSGTQQSFDSYTTDLDYWVPNFTVAGTSDGGAIFSNLSNNFQETNIHKLNANHTLDFQLQTNLIGAEVFNSIQELEGPSYLCSGYFDDAVPPSTFIP